MDPDLKFGSKEDIRYAWQYRAYGTDASAWADCEDPLKEGANPNAGYYCVQGTVEATEDYRAVTSEWAYVQIDRKETDRPVLTGWEDFVYNGSDLSPIIPKSAAFEQTGGTSDAKDAGAYSVTFTLTEN